MGLLVTVQIGDADIIAANEEFLNTEMENELPFDQRCKMKTVDHIYNDWDFVMSLDEITGNPAKNCEYVLLEEEDVHALKDQQMSEESQEVISQLIKTVDFSKQVVSLFAWW